MKCDKFLSNCISFYCDGRPCGDCEINKNLICGNELCEENRHKTIRILETELETNGRFYQYIKRSKSKYKSILFGAKYY